MGRKRPRGRENEVGFIAGEGVSEHDDTPEDVEDDDDPEFCQLIDNENQPKPIYMQLHNIAHKCNKLAF